MVEFRSGRSPVVFGILRFVGGARPALARFPGAMGFACGLGRGVSARFLVSWPGEVGRVSGGWSGPGVSGLSFGGDVSPYSTAFTYSVT